MQMMLIPLKDRHWYQEGETPKPTRTADRGSGHTVVTEQTASGSGVQSVQLSIDQEKWLPVLEIWSSMPAEQRTDAGEGVKILGRWHEMAGRTGVAIMEATDAAAIHRYLGQWNPHMDMDVSPVLDDEESVKAAKEILKVQAG